jgi:hypothetical protein
VVEFQAAVLDVFGTQVLENLPTEDRQIRDGTMGIHWAFAFVALHDLYMVVG